MTPITDETTRFIDISKYQLRQNLDWSKLPADIAAVVIRSTYGTTRDPRFAIHLESTVDARRVVGAYHFVTYADPDAQWIAFRDTLREGLFGDAEDMLPVLDCEWLPGETRIKDKAALIRNAHELLTRCDEEFGGAIIYTATGFWEQLGRPEEWLDRTLWLAHYPRHATEQGAREFADKVYTPYGAGEWEMWQSGPRPMPGFDRRTGKPGAKGIDYNYSRISLPVIGERCSLKRECGS